MDTIRALKQVMMFKDVTESVLRIVAAAAEEVTVATGEVLVAPTDRGGDLYVIRNGTVHVQAAGAGTPPVLFGAGETLGELQFMDHERAGGTATALERTELLVIRSAKLADALAAHPRAELELYRAIARSLAGRLRRAVAMLAFANERRDAA